MPIVTVKVLQEDIDQGRRFDCHLCPVAQALVRVVKDDVGVSVLIDFTYLDQRHGEMGVIKTPQEVRTFIFQFDTGIAVNPIDFEADIPQEFLR